VVSRILAFRPASVVERLGPRSGACPLSTRDLLAPAVDRGLLLPLVHAPVALVARAALLAAKDLRAVIGLALPAGSAAGPWFEAVTGAADEVAAGAPFFLAGEVVVAGEGVTQIERAVADAWRLVTAGLTHLAVDASAVAPGERGRIVAEVAAGAAERGLCVELVVPLADAARGGGRASAVLEALARHGTLPDLASLRCRAPADDAEARLQAAALARLSQALGGVPVMRRGPVTPALLDALRGSPVKICDDGGALAAGALAALPGGAAPSPEERDGGSTLERALAALPRDGVERLEARAFFDALDLLERLGASGGAEVVAGALEGRLEAP
jgi:hypothetical protein